MNHNEFAERLATVAEAIRALPDACPELSVVVVEDDRVRLMPSYKIMARPSAVEAFADLADAFDAEVDIRRSPVSDSRDLLTEFEHHGLILYATQPLSADRAYKLMDAIDRVLPDRKTVTLSAQDFKTAVERAASAAQQNANGETR